MYRVQKTTLLAIVVTGAVLATRVGIRATPPGDANVSRSQLPSIEEARERARLLHESMHATLQIVHHQYYREDEGLAIPAATLKRVFDELAKRSDVKLRWLVVDGDAMNVDHLPQDEFEKEAVAALAAGKREFERTKNGVYRHASAIALRSECLKCHLPNRKSTEERTAGLIIDIPVIEK